MSLTGEEGMEIKLKDANTHEPHVLNFVDELEAVVDAADHHARIVFAQRMQKVQPEVSVSVAGAQSFK